MPSFKLKIGLFLMTVLFLIPNFSNSQVLNSEVTISGAGIFSAKNIKVFQLAGPTFFARLNWGETFIRITVKTNDKTVIKNAMGEIISYKDIKEDQLLNVKGIIEGGQSLSVVATELENASNKNKPGTFSGKIKKVNSSSDFVVSSDELGEINVLLKPGVMVKKGNRTLSPDILIVGDKVSNITGVMNYSTNKIEADSITVYVDMGLYNPRNFQGILKSIKNNGNGNFELLVNINGYDATVYTTEKTEVLNVKKGKMKLTRFNEEDNVRFYGARRETDGFFIDAEILRNLDL